MKDGLSYSNVAQFYGLLFYIIQEVAMKFLYEIFPVALFFLAFKFYGIYFATYVGIIATLAQVLMTKIFLRRWDNTQLFAFGTFAIFGGLTIYLHDPIFVKWKPTIIFWVFGVMILGSQFLMKKSLTQHLMDKMFQNENSLPTYIWNHLNLMWAIYFIVLGFLNLYFAYYFSTDAWVNFKFFGITGGMMILGIIQAIYVKHVSKK
jgi:intracellular septation protein